MWSFWGDCSAYHTTPRTENAKGGHFYQNAAKTVALVEIGAGGIRRVNNYCQTAPQQGWVGVTTPRSLSAHSLMSCHYLSLPRPSWPSEDKEAQVLEFTGFSLPRFRLGQIKVAWVSRDKGRLAGI